MKYEKPEIVNLGSIGDHTFMPNPGGNEKGGGDLWHYDWKCEMSAALARTAAQPDIRTTGLLPLI